MAAPWLAPRLMAPRVGWKRIPISLAARMVSSSLFVYGRCVKCSLATFKLAPQIAALAGCSDSWAVPCSLSENSPHAANKAGSSHNVVGIDVQVV